MKAVHFIIEEEKRFILDDRSANRKPKLVALVRVHRPCVCSNAWIEIIASSPEAIPTPEVICIPMKLVGTAFRYYIDNRAGIAAVFGVEIVGNDTKLLG